MNVDKKSPYLIFPHVRNNCVQRIIHFKAETIRWFGRIYTKKKIYLSGGCEIERRVDSLGQTKRKLDR